MDINAKVLAAFQVEHKEQLEGIRSGLAAREKDDGPAGAAALDEAFRLAHSLKGGARVCDLQAVETLGHRLEALFSRVRQGNLRVRHGASSRSGLLAVDAIEDWMAALARGPAPRRHARGARGDRHGPRREARPAAAGRPARPDIHQRVRAAFQAEHKEYLAASAPSSRPGRRADRAAADLDEVFRLVNSLKGGRQDRRAARRRGRTSQRLEALFLKAREDPSRLDKDAVRVGTRDARRPSRTR